MKPTETTDTLLRALSQARKLDLIKLAASAVDIELASYTPDRPDHVERVSIPAEHMAPVRDALVAALTASIVQRRAWLARQIKDIDGMVTT